MEKSFWEPPFNPSYVPNEGTVRTYIFVVYLKKCFLVSVSHVLPGLEFLWVAFSGKGSQTSGCLLTKAMLLGDL